ncbi:Sulfotransferase, partial [Halocaridina rubra]
ADHVLDHRVFQFPEIIEKFKGPLPQAGERLALATSLPSPRTLKTHMPFSLLPPKLLDTCKVIYLARNPRDVVVSYYHHHRMWLTHGFTVMWSPFWSHLGEAWERREHTNLLLLTYEQLKEDLPAVIKKVALFLGKPISEDNMKTLTAHLHIDSMKNNPAVNAVAEAENGLLDLREGGFVRQGKLGGWREYFDDEMSSRFDRWIRDKGQGLDEKFNWT